MLWLMTACGGGDQEFDKLYPELLAYPTALAFGDVALGYSSTELVLLQNVGQAALSIDSVTLEDDGDGSFSATLPTTPLVLKADESVEFPVSFVPGTYFDYAGLIHVISDDPNAPELDLDLSGTGVDAPLPDIELDALSVDFGDADVGNVVTKTLAVQNVGGGTLNIGSVTQPSGGSGAFELVGDIDGYAIPPGQSQTLVLLYSPTHVLGDSGTLLVTSDDPDEPEVEVQLVGNGGGDYEYPVAVIDCPGESEPRTTVSLDGSGSYDPEGYDPLTYEWSIVSLPDGSTTTELIDDTQPVSYLELDLAGDYETQLKVTNSIGLVSAPATCVTSAIPDEQLHVELIWDTGAADMDLHLVLGEYALFDGTYDCNYCNQGPEWGESGIDDNPSLDLDDRYGYGPENINIETPADGSYEVWVHYFASQGDSTVVATVKVYLYGLEVSSMSKAMELDNAWHVGQIQWPDGLFATVDEVVEEPESHSCD